MIVRCAGIVGWAGLSILACSSESGGTGSAVFPPECPQPVGAYRVTFVKLGGSCADLPPRVVILDEPDPPSCTRTYQRGTRVATGCKLDQKGTCTSSDGTTETETMSLDIPSDVRQITGTFTFDAHSASGQTCTGTYMVTYVKS